jgi:hypothetical protein
MRLTSTRWDDIEGICSIEWHLLQMFRVAYGCSIRLALSTKPLRSLAAATHPLSKFSRILAALMIRAASTRSQWLITLWHVHRKLSRCNDTKRGYISVISTPWWTSSIVLALCEGRSGNVYILWIVSLYEYYVNSSSQRFPYESLSSL